MTRVVSNYFYVKEAYFAEIVIRFHTKVAFEFRVFSCVLFCLAGLSKSGYFPFVIISPDDIWAFDIRLLKRAPKTKATSITIIKVTIAKGIIEFVEMSNIVF